MLLTPKMTSWPLKTARAWIESVPLGHTEVRSKLPAPSALAHLVASRRAEYLSTWLFDVLPHRRPAKERPQLPVGAVPLAAVRSANAVEPSYTIGCSPC